MAVVALLSTSLTNAYASPAVLNSANLQNGNIRGSQALFTITSANSIGSTYRLGRIRSSDLMWIIHIYSPDIGTTTAADLGLYDLTTHANGGTVVDVDFFASGLDLAGGALNGVNITFEAAAAGGLIANGEKRVWEALGLAADPFKEYDIALTLTGTADGTGTGLVRWQFASGE